MKPEVKEVLYKLINAYSQYASEETALAIKEKSNDGFAKHMGTANGFLRARYFIIDELLKEEQK